MSKPLGVDRLGRLVYEGDRIYWDNLIQDEPWPPLHPYFDDVVRFEGFEWGTKINDSCTVDLAASPRRSNYDRYFADFGTFEEMCSYASQICNDTPVRYCTEEGCPFALWGLDCHFEFGRWLQQEATE